MGFDVFRFLTDQSYKICLLEKLDLDLALEILDVNS